MTGTLFLLFTAMGMALAVLAMSITGLTSLTIWAPLAFIAMLALVSLALMGASEHIRVRSDD